MGMGNQGKAQAKALDRQTAAMEKVAAQDLIFRREQEERRKNEFNQQMGNIQEQQRKNDQMKADNIAMYQPGVDLYNSILGDLKDLTGPDSFLTKPYTEDDYMNSFEAKYLQDVGNKAMENSLAARGGALSGAAVKRGTELSMGIASQQYNNAVAREQQLRANRMQGIGMALNEGRFALDGTQRSRTPDTFGYDQNNLINGYSGALDNILGNSQQTQNNITMGIGNAQAQYELSKGQGGGIMDILTGAGMGALGGFATGGFYGALGGAGAGALGGMLGQGGSSMGMGSSMGTGIKEYMKYSKV